MEDNKKHVETTEKNEKKQGPERADWATEALEELDDFIESQGIYIRQ